QDLGFLVLEFGFELSLLVQNLCELALGSSRLSLALTELRLFRRNRRFARFEFLSLLRTIALGAVTCRDSVGYGGTQSLDFRDVERTENRSGAKKQSGYTDQRFWSRCEILGQRQHNKLFNRSAVQNAILDYYVPRHVACARRASHL